MSYNLTALTHEELLAMRELFNFAFDLAEPVILLRDRIAQDAFDKGDDSFIRVYRQAPQLIIREGTIRQDGESLRERPDNFLDGDFPEAEEVEEVRSSSGGVRGAGNELASGESAEIEPKNNESQTD
jgi:hypothetical protein